MNAINDAISQYGVNQVGHLFNQKLIEIYQQIGVDNPGKKQYVQGWINQVNDYSWTYSVN